MGDNLGFQRNLGAPKMRLPRGLLYSGVYSRTGCWNEIIAGAGCRPPVDLLHWKVALQYDDSYFESAPSAPRNIASNDTFPVLLMLTARAFSAKGL